MIKLKISGYPSYLETVSSDAIKIGTFIKIASLDQRDKWYGCIVRMLDNYYLITDHPVDSERDLMPLQDYDHLECKFNLLDGLYTFHTRFISFFSGVDWIILEKTHGLLRAENTERAIIPYLPARINALHSGTILSLSTGGLLLATDYKLGIGSVVRLDFKLEESSFDVKGQVVHMYGNNNYGISFIEEELSKRMAIELSIYGSQLEA